MYKVDNFVISHHYTGCSIDYGAAGVREGWRERSMIVTVKLISLILPPPPQKKKMCYKHTSETVVCNVRVDRTTQFITMLFGRRQWQ